MSASISRPFGSVLTAMVTPFTDDGEVDIPTAVAIAQHLVDHGHDGILVNGTTGESPTTHVPEKAALLRAVVDAVGQRATIVAGAGSNDTEHSLRMARDAADAGAAGLLVVTPYYSRPSQEGLVQHFHRIADATDLPIMIYDIPIRTGVRIEDQTWQRLAAHDRIVACKDATGDVGAALRKMVATGLAWYSGDDALNLALLTSGAAGVVSVVGHVAGDAWAQVARAVDAGDLPRARAVFSSMIPLVQAIMGGGQGAPMVKAALELLGLLPNRTVRLPIAPASPADVDLVRAALVATGLLAA